MFLSMMAATGQGGTPGTAGQAAGAAPNAQRGAQDGTQRFTLPPFIMGPDNEVHSCPMHVGLVCMQHAVKNFMILALHV